MEGASALIDLHFLLQVNLTLILVLPHLLKNFRESDY
jgi:hypothetical protein